MQRETKNIKWRGCSIITEAERSGTRRERERERERGRVTEREREGE